MSCTIDRLRKRDLGIGLCLHWRVDLDLATIPIAERKHCKTGLARSLWDLLEFC
jgi:hypothetical protein